MTRAMSQPKYLALAATLRTKVMAGEWREGERIPAERQLGVSLGVSRPTIGKALGQLVSEGLLTRRQGSGTFVGSIASGKLVRFLHYKVAGPGVDIAYHMELLQGVEERLAAAGLRVLFSSAHAQATEPEPAERGLVAVGPVHERMLRQYRAGDRPVVVIDHDVLFADCVAIDNSIAAQQCTAALIAQGHERICFVSDMRQAGEPAGAAAKDDGEWPNSARRRAGYETTMRKAGLTPRVIASPLHAEVSARLRRERPTAIFFSSARVAQRHAAAFLHAPKASPCPVFAAFGSRAEARSLPPSLRLLLLAVDWHRMGETAAALLLERLQRGNGTSEETRRVLLRPRLLWLPTAGDAAAVADDAQGGEA